MTPLKCRSIWWCRSKKRTVRKVYQMARTSQWPGWHLQQVRLQSFMYVLQGQSDGRCCTMKKQIIPCNKYTPSDNSITTPRPLDVYLPTLQTPSKLFTRGSPSGPTRVEMIKYVAGALMNTQRAGWLLADWTCHPIHPTGLETYMMQKDKPNTI